MLVLQKNDMIVNYEFLMKMSLKSWGLLWAVYHEVELLCQSCSRNSECTKVQNPLEIVVRSEVRKYKRKMSFDNQNRAYLQSYAKFEPI